MSYQKYHFIDWSDNLLSECIDALGSNITIYDDYVRNQVWEGWEKRFPQHFKSMMGRVNWSSSEKCYQLIDIAYVKQYGIEDTEVYVLWDNQNFVISTKLIHIIEHYDDVTAVSFDTWFVSVDYNFVIEHYHEGEILLGFD